MMKWLDLNYLFKLHVEECPYSIPTEKHRLSHIVHCRFNNSYYQSQIYVVLDHKGKDSDLYFTAENTYVRSLHECFKDSYNAFTAQFFRNISQFNAPIGPQSNKTDKNKKTV